MGIVKVNNVEDDEIAKIDGVEAAAIAKYGGQTLATAPETAIRWLITSTAGKIFYTATGSVTAGSIVELIDLGTQTFNGISVGQDGSGNKRWILHQDNAASEIWYANDSGTLDAVDQWTSVNITNGKTATTTGGPTLAWGNNKWVGVGGKRATGGKYYTAMSSSDGATWEEIESGVFTTNAHTYTVGYKDTNFWAFPQFPNMFTSSDGITWGITTGTTTVQINSMAYDGVSKWVLAGAGGKIFYSNDNFATIATGSYPHTSNIFGIVYAKGSINKWSAVGASGKMAYSTDGITFSASTLPGVVGSTRMRAIATDNTTMVAVGNSGMILTSSDGVSWLRVSSSDATGKQLNAVSSDVIGAGWR